jgi:tRNA pseudouridine13 synthase
MKVKAKPADFVVRERTDSLLLVPHGPYSLFRLAKRSWDTFDLVDLLARRMGVRRSDISVGGMKDRHGATEQIISVRGLRGRPRSIEERNFSLRFIGNSDRPFSAKQVRGNGFSITLRDIGPRAVDRIRANAQAVAVDGFPNYYDEQRFGSARHGAGFMGKEIFLGRRENALRLYFTPSKYDDQRTRKLKKCVTDNWGRWDQCLALGFGEYGGILSYLAGSRRAYHQALEMIDRKFLLFTLNAYQSFLFNEVLARFLRARAGKEGFALHPLRYAFGTLEFYGSLPHGAAELAGTLLPIPGYDSALPDESVRAIVDEVLAAEGIGLADLKVRQMRRIAVHGMERPAVVVPQELAVSDGEEDDLYPGRRKLNLEFFLPRGSYATILIKRIGMTP